MTNYSIIHENKNILVVDDDTLSLKLIVSYLQAVNKYSVFEASLVSEAEVILEEEKIDLIITDWQMPSVSGIEFSQQLKSQPKTSEIPIILITGAHLKQSDIDTAYNSGVTDFIKKPFEQAELKHRINAVFALINYRDNVISQNTKKLASFAASLTKYKLQQKNLLEQLYAVKEKAKINTDLFTDLEQIIQQCEINQKIDQWDNYEHYFNMLHPQFTKNLTKKFPELSPSDLRLAILLRLRMDSKSIARTLNVTEDSVKTFRKRLRTKLKLERKDNLVAFISNF